MIGKIIGPFLFIVLLSYSLDSFSQKRKKGISYKFNISKLEAASDVVWYGVDFSKCKITDGSKMSEGYQMKEKYIPGWISLMNQRYDLDYIRRKLKKNVSEDLNTIQKLYKNIDERELVTFSNYSFPIERVKAIVKDYPLPEKSGIGFILIIENLNKPDRFITGYFTFFDLYSREIICATKMKGLPGSKYGFSQWWKEGMVELFDYYFRDYHRRLIKSNTAANQHLEIKY